MKSGNLNFLEPSGPLQACNGTALPLPFSIVYLSALRKPLTGVDQLRHPRASDVKIFYWSTVEWPLDVMQLKHLDGRISE